MFCRYTGGESKLSTSFHISQKFNIMSLWSWGANSHGQLGLGCVNEQVEKPTKVELHLYDNKVKQVACGGGHSLMLDSEGKLFSCGWNSKLQLALEKDVDLFHRTWRLSGIHFNYIACGWESSCGVTDDHFLFVWGSNSHGQLGLPKDHFSETMKPIRLQINAVAVSMGLRHAAIINPQGHVWTTGCGRHGQLGLGDEVISSDRFQKVIGVGIISHIACGQNHTVAWSTDEKALYVWGDNKYGQLLLCSKYEKYRKLFRPNKIDIDVKQPVRKLLSGWTNVLLWLENGAMLAWGRNNLGQLGTKEDVVTGRFTHIQLPDGRQVKDVVLGSEHTICLATDNTLWAWGWNEHRNTGVGSGDIIQEPTLVPIDMGQNAQITQIYCGGAQNFIVIEENNIAMDVDDNEKVEDL